MAKRGVTRRGVTKRRGGAPSPAHPTAPHKPVGGARKRNAGTMKKRR